MARFRCVFAALLFGILALPVRGLAADASDGAAAAGSPLAVVKRLYAGFDSGDMAAVLDCIAADAVWKYYGPEYALPFAGTFHGPSGVAAFFKIVDDTLTDVRAGQREYLVSGDQVIVPGWEESTVRATGGHYKVDNVHLFRVRDGKIIRFEEFINSSDVLEGFMPADPQRGAASFTGCAACHGNDAEGNRHTSAPRLAGLDSEYLVRQLRQFRDELRGGTGDDLGFAMNGRSRSLPGDRGIRDVAAYIASLPIPSGAPRSDATRADAPWSIADRRSLARGERAYRERCASCHGHDGEGVPTLGAPLLRSQDPDYLLRQLRLFSKGVRGGGTADPRGSQMRAAVATLADGEARDIAAFLGDTFPASAGH